MDFSVHCCAMEGMTPADKRALLMAIARREGNANELSKRFGYTTKALREFVAQNQSELVLIRERLTAEASEAEPSPEQLDDLWITKKFERLKRLQELAELQYQDAAHGDLVGPDLSTALREFRSYLALAANELGQLLHRGSGESGTDEMLNVNIEGVDMEKLR
jgi:hypothetical protein